MQQIREGLALLVAMKHVDPAAWRFTLVKYWNIDVGSEGERLFEEEIRARFDLTLNLEGREQDDAVTDFDLVRFCGTHQREHGSDEYIDMLGRIASLDADLQRGNAGLDINIPFRCVLLYFPREICWTSCEGSRGDPPSRDNYL